MQLKSIYLLSDMNTSCQGVS